MYKYIFLVLASLYAVSTFAIANIVMPDMLVTSQVINDSDESGFEDITSKDISKVKPKFSSDIRGALIKSSYFKVLDSFGESTGNNYYLYGEVNYIGENEDSYPIKDTNNISKQFVLEVEADFKLVRAKDNVIMANFSATGSSSDVKIVSTVNKTDTVWHHNVGKLIEGASTDLASNVLTEMMSQFNLTISNEKNSQPESVVVTDVKVYQ